MRNGAIPVVLLTMAWTPTQAQQAPTLLSERALDMVRATAPADWRRVGSERLAMIRGGFTTATGLSLSLGIERLVSINGEVVAHTNFQIANVSNISAEEARHARDAINSVNLVQNGPNNFAVSDPLNAARATFVQNSLNGQTISSQTIISSSVNSMSLLKDLNFQAGLRDATIRAIGTN
ncbi:MAG: hypothetical protein JWR65_4855 [Massilia sp.]|jgi:hypothetical protein|nr:hypothetical protein [Massilia sp.]